jgi:CelD/BcsL family acetyltransferase involved in cellulose biosynthesis
MTLQVEWVETLERLEQLREPWDALAEPEGVPSLRYEWLLAWWHAFGGRAKLRMPVVWRGDELEAVFPLCARGRRLIALANGHTIEFKPFGSTAGVDLAVRTALDTCSSLQLSCVPREVAEHLSGMSHGRLVECGHHQTSPVVMLPDGYAAYRAGMPRRVRSDLDRCRRAVEREHEGVRIFAAARPVDLEAELARGFAVEASGWKGRRGTAVHSTAGTRRFYLELARAWHARGALRLSTIEADGETVAFDYALADYGRLWILKGGYLETYRRYAPGLVLTMAQIEAAAAEGLEAVELLGDATPWKLKFANAEREYRYLHAYRRRPVPAARFAWHTFARPRLRHAYHRLLPHIARRG